MKDGKEIAARILAEKTRMLIGLKGLDKKPWIYPLGRSSEINGTFYWLADKSTQLYGALSINPDCQIYLEECDGTLVRLSGKALFSEDEKIISECLKGDKEKDPAYQIAFCLKDARLTLEKDGVTASYAIKLSGDVITGIVMKKDREIRDRLAKIIEQRAVEVFPDQQLQKFYDGIMLVFAEKAKQLWPSFNMMPLENALIYETYDEREKYRSQAVATLGNISIKQVEDLSYYLSKDTLSSLMKSL